MHSILAMDAGGTTTRAVIIDATGHVHGYGLAGGGNPTSAGFDAALASVAAAAAGALGASRTPRSLTSAVIVMAGFSSLMPRTQIHDRLAMLGVSGEVHVDSDLLGAFCSGTTRPDGYALVAGTGAVAARIRDGALDAVADGTGWLLGDTGSGYWIGHRVVTAVVAALDGRGPRTALTELLLANLALAWSPQRLAGRPRVLLELMQELYGLRPVELSRFAPLAFQRPDDDVAREILADAARLLTGTLAAVRANGLDGPVVLGGGLLTGPPQLAALLNEGLGDADVIPVATGVVGAAVLALRRAGVDVDPALFERLRRDVAAWSTGAHTS